MFYGGRNGSLFCGVVWVVYYSGRNIILFFKIFLRVYKIRGWLCIKLELFSITYLFCLFRILLFGKEMV